jgi:hypothetical protein
MTGETQNSFRLPKIAVSLPGSLCARLSVAPTLSTSADAFVILQAPSVL